MEAIGPLVEVFKLLFSPLSRRVGYVKNLKKNSKELSKKASDLHAKLADVNQVISRDDVYKQPTNECKNWLQKVNKAEGEAKEITEEYEKNQRCLGKCFPDIYSRKKLGKRMVDLISDITELIEERSKFQGGEVVDAPIEPVERTIVPQIEAATAIDCTLQKILKCIRNEKTQKIGIWGMGGVGKTTVMKLLNNQQEIKDMFDIVIWVTVSKGGSVGNVQNDVVKRLSLSKEMDESEDQVARKVYHKLENKKFLLLLDDLWAETNLNDVGFPPPTEQNGCKVVLTTRDKGVCNKMDTDAEIKVAVMNDEEAWKLFHEKVGSVAELPPIQSLARSVAKECGGLPLALTVVGGALRKEENIHVWENALSELRSPATSEIEGMDKEVYKQLKFSYDRLLNDYTKDCFLYCALYPEDEEISVDELIEYWRADGFIRNAKTLIDARNKGHTILKELLDASLLERCGHDRCVKLHDVIRDMALRITSPTATGDGRRFLVRAGVRVRDPPEEVEWEQVNKMSLMYSELESLPERPECPMLSTLLLQRNYMLRTIPDSFFERMHALQVLDLSKTSIPSLPASICNLVSLRGLYLNDCWNLHSLPSQVGALKKLEVLQLACQERRKDRSRSFTVFKIRRLPNELGELACLKSLKLSLGGRGKFVDQQRAGTFIPIGITSRLTLLEELSIDNERAALWDHQSLKNVAEELESLKKLNSLQFCFTEGGLFERFIEKSLSWKERCLTRFRFVVINCLSNPYSISHIAFDEKWERSLSFLNGDSDSIPCAIVEVLSRAEYFELSRHSTIRNLLQFGVQNLQGLKDCTVKNCEGVESMIVVDEGVEYGGALLPNLEKLVLSSMTNLRSVWKGSVPPGSLGSLSDLTLEECPKLRKIFSSGMIQQLCNLESLRVTNCQLIQEIITEEELSECQNHHYLLFPKLNTLYLLQLPKLVTVCRGVWAGPSLKLIRVSGCPNLKKLPLDINNASTLKSIKGNRSWFEALVWENDATKQLLQPFFSSDF